MKDGRRLRPMHVESVREKNPNKEMVDIETENRK